MRYVAWLLLAAGVSGCSLLVSTSGFVTDSVESGGDASPNEAGANDAPAQLETGPLPPNAYSVAVKADSPVGYWRLEETSGLVAFDEIANTHPGGYGGTFTREPGAFKGSRAAVFDGETSRIDVGRFFAFVGTAPFSIEVWVKPAVVNTLVRWIFSRNQETLPPGEGPGIGYELYYGLDYVLFQRNLDGGSGYATGPSLTANRWTYLVATFDGVTNRIYVDGQLTGESQSSVVLTDPPESSARWGDRPNGAGKYLGTLDELAIYDKPLSATRIRAHFDAATALGRE